MLRYVGVCPIDRSPVDGPPSSAHSGRNRGGRTIGPALRSGRAFARIPRNQVAATPPIPHSPAVSSFQRCWRWSCPDAHARQRAASATGPTPHRAIRRFRHGKHPPGWCRLTSFGSWGRVASQHARRHGPLSPDEGEDRVPGLGACWSRPRWLGEGSTVVANAERVKDAAEAYRYGYRQRGGRDGMTVVAAPTGVFSILGRVQGRSARVIISRPGRSRTSLPRRSAQRSGHCVDRCPHQQRRRS
jgi:hypothetical protein